VEENAPDFRNRGRFRFPLSLFLFPVVGPYRIGDVPGDRFPLAVGVRGKVDRFRGARRLDDLAEQLLPFLDDDIGGGEAVFDVHAQTALGQILDVPHGRRPGTPFRGACIVLAFAGDSTTTSDLAILPPELDLGPNPGKKCGVIGWTFFYNSPLAFFQAIS
jgi:hypothetical protein